MIIVLVPHRGPPQVERTTAEAIAARVADSDATGIYIATLPPGEPQDDGPETAWRRLSLSVRLAERFQTVDEALEYFGKHRGTLSSVEVARIVSMLRAL